MAGFPSYVWGTRKEVRKATRNTLFGIVVSPDGSATAIPSPFPPGHLTDVRALALRNGDWAATFADVDPETQFNTRTLPKAQSYWFGITNGKTWRILERIPHAEGVFQSAYASKLVLSRVGYSVAIPIGPERDRRGRVITAAAVFTKGGDGWTRRDKLFAFVNYVALDTTEKGGLLLGAVATAESDVHVKRELLVFGVSEKDSPWQELLRLPRDSSNRIHHPDIGWVGTSLTATWLETTSGSEIIKAKAVSGLLQPDGSRVETISAKADQVIPLFHAAIPTWIVTTERDSLSKRLALVQLSEEGKVYSNFEIIAPFRGFIGAASFGRRLLIIGPVPSVDKAEPIVSSQLLTLELTCSLGS